MRDLHFTCRTHECTHATSPVATTPGVIRDLCFDSCSVLYRAIRVQGRITAQTARSTRTSCDAATVLLRATKSKRLTRGICPDCCDVENVFRLIVQATVSSFVNELQRCD